MSEQHAIDHEADIQAVSQAVAAGRPVDPEIAERVRQHAEEITQEIYRKHGYLQVVVDTVREVRNDP